MGPEDNCLGKKKLVYHDEKYRVDRSELFFFFLGGVLLNVNLTLNNEFMTCRIYAESTECVSG